MANAQAFTMEQTWLECIKCGHRADLLLERKFRCPNPDCNGLYDVQHNFPSSVRRKARMQEAFDERTRNRSGALKTHQSGVWRFKELVMPYLPDEYIVTLGEGLQPILPAGKNLIAWIGADIDLHIICEGMTMTGAFKDYGMTTNVSVANAAGIKVTGCASTGDTSASLAAYAAAAGIRCFVILPAGKITPVQLAQPLAHGALVITIPGTFDDCMRIMQELVAEYGVYPANSLNPTRIEGHQATVFLTAQYFDWTLPHWFAVPIGNGSNSSSVGKGIRTLRELGLASGSPHILGCQSEAAHPLAHAWNVARTEKDGVSEETWKKHFAPMPVGETTATAARIGNPVSRDKVIREIVASRGAMQIASEEDLNAAVLVAGKDGFLVCPQTGMALAGVRNAVREGWIKKGERVVVVSTATGLKFTEAIAEGVAKEIVTLSEASAEAVAKAIGI